MRTSPPLPGVSSEPTPPAVRCNPRLELRRARREAWLRDLFQISLLLAVDLLFLQWPETRLPALSRERSVEILAGVNALLLAWVWLTRALPKWQAARIASTWSRNERGRLSAPGRR